MSNIDKRALRQTAEKAQEHGVFNMDMHSQTVLALLDELEAAQSYAKERDEENQDLMLTVGRLRVEKEVAEKRVAELSHHLQSAHEFIEHTDAFGHEASNEILCCGDAQWNIDSSKAALASTGRINGEG
ncbi:hypothetical protein DPF84_04645 [Enterobacter hormaechei]|uniref:ead/Ea22-like family protein n=1 Tax=Enterobacter hormaechei TaxID=158836 RepID=UPI000DBEF7DA|nr:ead/Ea22-like family protein [Enterobacter hormaechei]AWX01079.1 hypothetical protein DPF84_04645 [Enterobacter hormaechei]MCL8147040.1 ead/Ea22-like family protein [Enterobacter hormaechei]MCM7929605.1 ead/Ea22-like family protein [Enterobacter hormaechei]MCM7949186.1 ead/Ea22-like family protein [Enterobacter hormaechei]RAM39844.1 hypothetical protein DOZ52_27015 [Enterobacter hormaechei]